MATLTFTEFEAFAEAVQDASLAMRLTALGEQKWTLQYEFAGSMRLQKGYEGGGNVTEGVTFGDAWTFYHQPRLPVHANGQVVSADEVFVAPPNTEFCLACQPPHGWLTAAIRATDLFPAEQQSEFADSAKPHVLKPPPGAVRRFTSLIERFLATAESRPQIRAATVAMDAFQSELAAAARGLFVRRRRGASPSFAAWHGQVKSTVKLAMGHPIESLSIADLARQGGVPERSLRRAFQRCYGLSPIESIRNSRLHQARQLLGANCPDETTVTRVAFSLGFWDLGRFAGAYRRLFGELPSETLRKPPRR